MSKRRKLIASIIAAILSLGCHYDIVGVDNENIDPNTQLIFSEDSIKNDSAFYTGVLTVFDSVMVTNLITYNDSLVYINSAWIKP